MSPDETHRDARAKLDGMEQTKEPVRDVRSIPFLETLLQDVRFGLRMLRKNSVLTMVAVLTLALGIGANTAIFTLLYGLVLRSLPAANAGQLVKVGIASSTVPDDAGGSYMPYRIMEALSKEQSSFRELSAWSEEVVLMKDHGGSIQRYIVGLVGGNAFGLLGLQPYRGRLIAPYDDVRGGPTAGWPVVLKGRVNRASGSRASLPAATGGATIAVAGSRRASISSIDRCAAARSSLRLEIARSYSAAGTSMPRRMCASTSGP